MAETVPIDIAARELGALVCKLHRGETLTLVDAEGAPVAVLVSLKPGPESRSPAPDGFGERWEALAGEIGRAWQGEQSAVQVLAEMRR